MATAHEWIAYDTAAQAILNGLIGQCGYSYRQFADLSNGSMSYNRVRDIELGRRAPVRLSEFLIICDVCHADPVETLRRIIREAQRIEAQQQTASAVDLSDDEARIAETKRILAEDPMSLAAYHDPDKQHYIDGDGIDPA